MSYKLLVISLAGIGDTLLATPLIHELRLHFPQAQLDAFVMWAGSRDLLQANPHLDTVYHKNLLREGHWASLQYFRELGRQGYDVSLNTYPQSKIEYRVGAFLTHARERLSHTYDNFTILDRFLVTRTMPQDYGLHAIENNLRLLDLLELKPKLPRHDSEIYLAETEQQWAQKVVQTTGLQGRKLLGIHVGSGKTKNLELRRWPLDMFIALIQRLVACTPGVSVLLFGGPEEQGDHETILRQVSDARVLVAPSKTLRQAAALLGQCDVFLSVDTALMHVAAAMKVPRQLVIETPTFNKTIQPFNRPFQLIPNPAVHGRNLEYYKYDGRGIRGTPEELEKCMRTVTVEAVLQQTIEALAS